MRIIQVVTLITPDGAYGGPTRVAVNQARSLIDVGHHVVLAAAARGYSGSLPRTYGGVPVMLFPAVRIVPGIGFAGLTSPALQSWLRTAADSADLLHIHAARDFVTLPAALLARKRKVPYVLQTHGMIDPSSRLLAGPLDMALTRRALTGAKHVFYLTETERRGLLEVGGERLSLAPLHNGVPLPEDRRPASEPIEVLYLARLQERKRPLMFVRMAARLRESYPEVRFTLIGPDEGQGAAVQALISSAGATNVSWLGPLDPEQTIARFRKSAIYVLPSINEPFPMSVLEAMSVGCPVVITNSCGLAPAVQSWGAGTVVDDGLDALTAAVDRLLADSNLRARMGERARSAIRTDFSMDLVRERLESHYGKITRPEAPQ